jgi:hypothetical protein
LRFSRLADRSNLAARSAGKRIVNWRSMQDSPFAVQCNAKPHKNPNCSAAGAELRRRK